MLTLGASCIGGRSAHRRLAPAIVFLFLLLFPLSPGAACQDIVPTKAEMSDESQLYMKVQLDAAVKVSHLKPGDVVIGNLSRDVYRGDNKLFPAGSQVRLVVDKLGRRRRMPNDYWPLVIKVFIPRHENYPTFQSASVLLPDGTEVPLSVSLIAIQNERSIYTKPSANALLPTASAPATHAEEPNAPSTAAAVPSEHSKEKAKPILTLQATTWEASQFPKSAVDEDSPSARAPTASVTLATGTPAKIILLDTVSASKSHPGDAFRARLIEPIWLESQAVLPAGTIFEGKVVKSTPPRMLSRAGSLLLSFTGLTVNGRADAALVASVTGLDLDQRSHTRIDPEGKLQGNRPGLKWMLINIAVTAGIAKEADDATQLIIEAIVSTATDVSTAGVARIVGTCASVAFMLTRHGRDVVVPKFTEMTIILDRPLTLTLSP
jgi:hypothetical protein